MYSQVRLAKPAGSENANPNTCEAPAPEFGVTESAVGGSAVLGVTVSVAVSDAPWYDDVITTLVLEETLKVVIGKFAVRAPFRRVTFTGTRATAAFALCTAHETPPGGATSFKMTVPVDEVPAETEEGVRYKYPSSGTTVTVLLSAS